ncbi:MAG: gluconate 2-dehydrogenase subunit 3 family protein [Rhodothermales bacterium]
MSELSHKPSRRAFLARSGAALGGGVLALNIPSLFAIAEGAHRAHINGDAFKTLSDGEAKEIEAFAEQILPTGDEPGVKEAGVIYFIDRALGDERSDLLPNIREGMTELTQRVQRDHGSGAMFSNLAAEEQIALMKQIEETEFFASLRFLTMAGMFTNPSYGGNRSRIGWKMIGFDDRHFWQPPFGFYDANYKDMSK